MIQYFIPIFVTYLRNISATATHFSLWTSNPICMAHRVQFFFMIQVDRHNPMEQWSWHSWKYRKCIQLHPIWLINLTFRSDWEKVVLTIDWQLNVYSSTTEQRTPFPWTTFIIHPLQKHLLCMLQLKTSQSGFSISLFTKNHPFYIKHFLSLQKHS